MILQRKHCYLAYCYIRFEILLLYYCCYHYYVLALLTFTTATVPVSITVRCRFVVALILLSSGIVIVSSWISRTIIIVAIMLVGPLTSGFGEVLGKFWGGFGGLLAMSSFAVLSPTFLLQVVLLCITKKS